MKNEEEFNSIYNTLYNKYFEKFERMRKSKKRRYVTIVIGIVFILIAHSWFEDSSKLEFIFFIIGLMILIISTFFNNKKEYSKMYKEEVITEFVKQILPEAEYRPYLNKDDNNNIMNNYAKAKFDERKYNKDILDDYLSWKNNDVNLCMSDMAIYYEYIDANKEKQSEEIFIGMFAYTKIEQSKDVDIRILNKATTSIHEKRNTVALDNDTFNKNFTIVSNSDINAYEILTADVIQELNNWYETEKIKFDISIINENIFFRFYSDPIFEPSINEPVMKKDNFVRYCNLFDFISRFTDSVNKIYDNLI